jgi:hypothetical protein
MPEPPEFEEAPLPSQQVGLPEPLGSTALGDTEQLGGRARRPLQFRVRHLMLFLFLVALISGVIHNLSESVMNGFTVLLALGGPVFVLLIVIAMAIRPAFSFPWKLSQQEEDPTRKRHGPAR